MTRVIYYTASTLNGFIADEQNSLAWLFAITPPEPHHHERFMSSVGAMVLGATTYEWLLREEDLIGSPEGWAQFHGDRPVFVFTHRTLPAPTGGQLTFLSGAVADHLPALLGSAGERDLWVVGGGDLAGQFLDAGSLHEVQVSIAPATLVAGAPLLPRVVGSDHLQLRDVEKRGQFAHLTYEVVQPAAP